MATSGENYWPPTGRTSWPLTVVVQGRAAVVPPLQRIMDRLYLNVAAAAISETTVTLRQPRG